MLRVGSYSGWAYTQGGLIFRVGLHCILRVGLYSGWAYIVYSGWAYIQGGFIFRVGLCSGWGDTAPKHDAVPLTGMPGQCVALGPRSSWHCSRNEYSIPGRGGLPEKPVKGPLGGGLSRHWLSGELW